MSNVDTTLDNKTLANRVMRETFRKTKAHGLSHGEKSLEAIRRSMQQAKRFVLDDSMASFLADLASATFNSVDYTRRPDIIASMRHTARLPYPVMWIEFNYRAFMKRQIEIGAKPMLEDQPFGPETSIEHVGYLLEQNPIDEHQIKITEYFVLPRASSENPFDTSVTTDDQITTFPFVWLFRTDDGVFHPNEKVATNAAEITTGIIGLRTDQIGVKYIGEISPRASKTVIKDWPDLGIQERYITHSMVVETGGIVRYMLSFLSALNDIPSNNIVVQPHGSYVGGGQQRKPLDHTILRLVLPKNTTTIKLAKRLIAMARKRWHEVRPHWRTFIKELGPVCERHDHLWSEEDASGHAHCSKCKAWRVWIVLPKGRGDPTLGEIHHDNLVVHR